jgi:hypothetical protein
MEDRVRNLQLATFNLQHPKPPTPDPSKEGNGGTRNVLREGGEGGRLRMGDGDRNSKLEFRMDSLAVCPYRWLY